MLKKRNKEYEKALNLYNKGHINKAIMVLDIAITKDLSNANLLNLKGLLLYMKGNLDEAVALWNINRDYNDDKIALSYLKDARNDYERIEFYNKSKILIENLNIDEAIELLTLCRESDFNCINVNSLLALCYLKKGDYTESEKYINKVLEIDKNNNEAITIKKEMNKFQDNKLNNKIILIPIIITLLIVGIFIKNKFITIYEENNKVDVSNNISGTEISEDNDTIYNTEEDKDEIEENKEEEKEESSQIEIKSLSEEEIKNNYLQASDNYDKNDYSKTKDILENTIVASNDSHLKDDMIFLLAATYEKLEDNKNAILKYEEYINTYKEGTYITESYYKLALLYKELNLDKSKVYANIIKKEYSNSIYYNNIIKGILES